MNITIIFLCMLTIPIGLGIFFLTRYFNAGARKKSQTAATAKRTPHKNWGIWILYLGIALILAIWTIYGALFFLGIAMLLFLDPSTQASNVVSDREKKSARQVYTWLFWSPLIAFPIFIAQLFEIYDNPSTLNAQVLAALVPSLVHIPLFLGLTSKNRFVFRHVQQGILLIAIRTGMASLVALNLNSHLDYAALLFFIGNGSLWLSGSMLGWNQIANGTCWWMDRKGEQIILQAAQPVNKVAPTAAELDKKLDQILNSMSAKEKQTAKAKALEAFQSGIQGEVRKNALNILASLGEVEKF